MKPRPAKYIRTKTIPVVVTTCVNEPIIMVFFSLNNCPKFDCIPIVNSRNATPNSAKMAISIGLVIFPVPVEFAYNSKLSSDVTPAL